MSFRSGSIGALALAALALGGCSTQHRLPRAYSSATPTGACTIGVHRFVDNLGVDHALDLRDHLRAHGPCRNVIIASGTDDERADVIVSGTVRSPATPDPEPGGMKAGSTVLGLGLGALIAGVVIKAVVSEPKADSRGLVSPDERRTYDTLQDLGTGLLVGGGITGTVGAGTMVLDGVVVRDMVLDATVDAEVQVWRGGVSVGTWSLLDKVKVRGRQASGRSESRTSFAAHGPLYREVLARVYDHVAARVTDLVAGRDPRPGAQPMGLADPPEAGRAAIDNDRTEER